MKLRDALIAWNPGTDQIRVGPLIRSYESNWTENPIYYLCTAGAAIVEVRKMKGLKAGHYIMSEFIGITVRDGVDPYAAHAEFMKIDEYREAIPHDATLVARLAEASASDAEIQSATGRRRWRRWRRSIAARLVESGCRRPHRNDGHEKGHRKDVAVMTPAQGRDDVREPVDLTRSATRETQNPESVAPDAGKQTGKPRRWQPVGVCQKRWKLSVLRRNVPHGWRKRR